MNDILEIDPSFFSAVHPHRHNDDVQAFVFQSFEPMHPMRFEQYVQSLVAVYGPDMLRYKGVLYFRETRRRMVFQGVHMVFSADALGEWGERRPENKIVIIGRNLPQEAIVKGFESCLAGEDEPLVGSGQG